jgi:hypothetical protein
METHRYPRNSVQRQKAIEEALMLQEKQQQSIRDLQSLLEAVALFQGDIEAAAQRARYLENLVNLMIKEKVDALRPARKSP